MIPSRKVLAALFAAAAAIVALALVTGPRVVVVAGRSMEPTLRAGQRVLVLRIPGWRGRLHGGELVLARAPRGTEDGDRLVIKRIASLTRTPHGAAAELRGDNPRLSRDSRSYGPVPLEDLRGVVIWPEEERRSQR